MVNGKFSSRSVVFKIERIKEAGAKDAQLQKVTSQGWPTRVVEVTLQTREFFDARGHLSISSGLLTYDDCTVIPVVMIEEILDAFTQATRV